MADRKQTKKRISKEGKLKKDIVAITEKLLEPIIKEHDYDLVDVEFVKENGQWYLRVFADKAGGITIDDCELISRALEVKLDEEDPIAEAYILEVSSPGLDRVLKKDKDFERYLGYSVDLKLYKARDKQKEFTGELLAYSPENITIEIEGKEVVFDRKELAMVRLSVFI